MAKSRGKNTTKASKGKPLGADHHRQMANTLYARARLHSAKAELIEAKSPKKKDGPGSIC